MYNREGLDDKITELLNIWAKKPDLTEWQNIVETSGARRNRSRSPWSAST